MGRSRAASRQADDDPNQRSKRKKAVLNAENLSTGHGINEGKLSLYRCNYCNKDISEKIHIKCVVCQDFDLCIECFSVGAEVTPHKSNHPYRVMDNLSFPLLCPDWNADEEMLLLEGIGMYGFGNWTEVAECVGAKSKSQCIDHYNAVYMDSPCFPLPDLSHVMGKSREELLARAKGYGEVKNELPQTSELTLKEERPFSTGMNSEEYKMEEPTDKKLASLTSVCGKAYSTTIKKAPNTNQINDRLETKESQADQSIGEKKPKLDGPSMTELSGYNFRREEFEVEYDNDAEQVLADMEFKDTDTEAEREMKLQVLRIYSKRLDERKRRKNFILGRNLLYLDPIEKSLSLEELKICHRYKVFMRFHSKEEHEELLKCIVEEHRIVRRIQDLQEARAAGCHTAAEACRFIDLKGTKEAEQSACKEGGKDSPVEIQAISRFLDDWDITGFTGAELLSQSEKELCNETRILPSHYLNMLQMMSLEISKGSLTKKSDAYTLFKVEPSKVDRVYDMLVKKGIAEA